MTTLPSIVGVSHGGLGVCSLTPVHEFRRVRQRKPAVVEPYVLHVRESGQHEHIYMFLVFPCQKGTMFTWRTKETLYLVP